MKKAKSMKDVWKEISILAMKIKFLQDISIPKELVRNWKSVGFGRFSFSRDIYEDAFLTNTSEILFGADFVQVENKRKICRLSKNNKIIEKNIFLAYYSTSFGYPKLAFHYSTDNGKLIYLRVDLSGNTFVNFLRAEMRAGNPELLKEIPKTLNNIDEIFDIHIYRQIDPVKEVEKILAMSGIRELVSSWEGGCDKL